MTQPTTTPVPPADDAEIIYYEGRPQFRADQMTAILVAAIGAGLTIAAILAMIFSWGVPGWALVGMVIAGILAVLIPVWLTRLTRYRISSYRVDFERGLITKRIDTLELWHVDDISFRQGIVDRMLNVGSIIILSDDKTTPRLELHGIPNPRDVFEKIKARVTTVKRQRGVIKVDTGS
jgi:membrane protein YdbS with pleckstrin-like domain